MLLDNGGFINRSWRPESPIIVDGVLWLSRYTKWGRGVNFLQYPAITSSASLVEE